MKKRIVALLSVLVGVCQLSAMAPQSPGTAAKAAMPVLVIQEIETASPEAYALLIAEVNKAVKQKLDIDNYVKVFLAEVAGPDSGKVFAVTGAESFSKLAEDQLVFEKELAMVKTRLGLAEVRKLGPQVGLKAVRWDGRNPTSMAFNTRAVLSDEAAYLKALDGLRALLDAHDFKDIKINCSRVVSGRSDYTHLISLNAPSAQRRAAMMDAISAEPWALDWVAAAAKYRTVVNNGTFREITK